MSNDPFMQIHLERGPNGFQEVSTVQAQPSLYQWENESMVAKLMRLCPPRLWPHGSYNNSCPRPILVNIRHELMLSELHTALTLSLTDIVDRWWSDKAAKFPDRMPLNFMEAAVVKVSKRSFSIFSSILAVNKVHAACMASISQGLPAAIRGAQRIVETRFFG